MADQSASQGRQYPNGKVAAGDLTKRVGVEVIAARGVTVEELLEKLIDATGAEFTTYYYYTILRMNLAGHEDYKEICEDARLEDRAHVELITPASMSSAAISRPTSAPLLTALGAPMLIFRGTQV